MGKLITHIKGYSAKLEAEKIKERTMRGKRERIKNGKLPTGRGILYGYDYDRELGINVANNNLATVKMIGHWLIEEGIFLNEACRRLMEKNIFSVLLSHYGQLLIVFLQQFPSHLLGYKW